MAVASLRRRAGKIAIDNKDRAVREQLKLREENSKKEELSPEEHQRRLDLLKTLGLVKE